MGLHCICFPAAHSDLCVAVALSYCLDQVQNFCILDDRPSAADAGLAPNFVHTDSNSGLTDADVERAISIIKCGPQREDQLEFCLKYIPEPRAFAADRV